jgi:hypothetical protein
LPCRIKETVKYVKEEVTDITGVEDILFGRGTVATGLLFESEAATPDGIDKDEEDDPACNTAVAT